jgi:hypothetical protein
MGWDARVNAPIRSGTLRERERIHGHKQGSCMTSGMALSEARVFLVHNSSWRAVRLRRDVREVRGNREDCDWRRPRAFPCPSLKQRRTAQPARQRADVPLQRASGAAIAASRGPDPRLRPGNGPPLAAHSCKLVDRAPDLKVARRPRFWSANEKRRMVAESLTPGASLSTVAQRYGLTRTCCSLADDKARRAFCRHPPRRLSAAISEPSDTAPDAQHVAAIGFEPVGALGYPRFEKPAGGAAFGARATCLSRARHAKRGSAFQRSNPGPRAWA